MKCVTRHAQQGRVAARYRGQRALSALRLEFEITSMNLHFSLGAQSRVSITGRSISLNHINKRLGIPIKTLVFQIVLLVQDKIAYIAR